MSRPAKKKALGFGFSSKKRKDSNPQVQEEGDTAVDKKTWNLAMVRAMTSQELPDLFVCAYLVQVRKGVQVFLNGHSVKPKLVKKHEDALIDFNETVERFLYILTKHKCAVQSEVCPKGKAVPSGRDWIAVCFHQYMSRRFLRFWVNPADVELEEMACEAQLAGLLCAPPSDPAPPPPPARVGSPLLSRVQAAAPSGASPPRPHSPSTEAGAGSPPRVPEADSQASPKTDEPLGTRARSQNVLPSVRPELGEGAVADCLSALSVMAQKSSSRPPKSQSPPASRVSPSASLTASPVPKRPRRPDRPSPPPLPPTSRERCMSISAVTPEVQRGSVEVKPSLRYILSEGPVAHLARVLDAYIVTPDPASTKTTTCLETAAELRNYLLHFSDDYYSCLVGVRAHRNVVDQAVKDKMGDPLGCATAPGELLVVQVVERQGRLVGVNESAGPDSMFVFCRCKAVVPEGVKLYTDIIKQDPSLVERRFCYPLRDDVKDELRRLGERDLMLLEKFVDSPLKLLSRKLIQQSQDVTFRYVAHRGRVGMESLKRAHRSEAVLSDAYELDKAKNLLDRASTSLPRDLTAEVARAAYATIREFFSTISASWLFKPTLQREYADLACLYDENTVNMAIARLRNTCSSNLERIKFNKHRLLQGILKKELTQWWLSEVNGRMAGYLAKQGFIADALPEHYIEHPPQDINHVKRNYALLKDILDPNSKYKEELMRVIESLKELVYPKIDAFLHDTKAVLSSELHFDLMSFDIDEVGALYEKHKSELEPQMANWMEGTIKDIAYLHEMKMLEDPIYAKEQGSLHIVPISGLAISQLVIKENAHKTALELWDNEGKARDGAAKQYVVPSLALHKAITAGQTKEAEQLIERIQHSTFNVNEQDSNGWTALHCAADDSHIKLCKRLLECGADPNIATTGRNTVLHLIVKKSFLDEKKQESVVKLVKKMLPRASVTLPNSLGETPLHVACLLNTVRMVKTLLTHPNANVNAKTNKNETCLHYAAMSGNEEVVDLLLQHGADLEVKTADGTTAMNLAIQLKHMAVVELLTAAFKDRSKV